MSSCGCQWASWTLWISPALGLSAALTLKPNIDAGSIFCIFPFFFFLLPPFAPTGVVGVVGLVAPFSCLLDDFEGMVEPGSG